jgi:hypothetical protein
MIQLNLLPDVKLEYIKAQNTRRLVVSVSFIVTAVAVAILVLLLLFDFTQKARISSLNNNIKSEINTLQGKKDISKILTVQNQLESLTQLHASKPAVSRLFTTYLDEITPGAISINNLTADFTQYTASITGSADSLTTVNKYVDTLKFTNYTSDQVSKPTPAFTNVVLSSFGLDTASGDPSQAASYTITFSMDKNIFDITQKVKLSVPNLITTRSELEQPGDLFKNAPTQGGQ